jgi:hypothetical protein
LKQAAKRAAGQKRTGELQLQVVVAFQQPNDFLNQFTGARH